MLHDWDDDHTARILTALGHSATSDTRLRIFEMLLPIDTTPHRAKLSDVLMLLLFDGPRERALGQDRDRWRHRLAAGAGRGQPRADERHPSQPLSARVTGSPGRWLQATKELVTSR